MLSRVVSRGESLAATINGLELSRSSARGEGRRYTFMSAEVIAPGELYTWFLTRHARGEGEGV